MVCDDANAGREEVEQIAVIGMAGRFPGAKDIPAFWTNLRNGVDSIRRFSDNELRALGVREEQLNHTGFVRVGSALEDMDKFDAEFFGMSPSEAEATDPQNRIFLECAWQALENAGYDPEEFSGPIGVYAGSNPNDYMHRLQTMQAATDPSGAFQALIGNEKDFLATRVSHKLNLTGPSLTVQTGCSTSLVAVHLASQSLLSYQCSMALAGGVSINLRHQNGYFYEEGMILSPDGYCRAFDADARGTVLGSGVGIVVLKRLSEALADGDTIQAVIIGAATNNDGAGKVSFTAPSVDGQAQVIALTHALAGVEAQSISYVEAHGTGTSFGDPIEIEALTEAFHVSTDRKQFCAIGSVKTNVGHLDAAAGVTGLIKTILALEHREIPPTLHYKSQNPSIDFENSPFYVNDRLQKWNSREVPRRAGVSSFGIGGTNAHVVLQEPPETAVSDGSRAQQLLLLSARTAAALDTAAPDLANHLEQHPDLSLADVAYTLKVGRRPFPHRRMLVARDRNDAVAAIRSPELRRLFSSSGEPEGREIVFMFPGQGSQYANMGLELYQTEPVFREHVDRCVDSLSSRLGEDLRAILYPEPNQAEAQSDGLRSTAITQPALFVTEYSLAQLWMSWGVRPAVLVGHSVGEYVAACLAGVLSLEDAIELIALRGRLIEELPRGSMLAVPLSEAKVQPLLNDNITLAAVNGPSVCVVSGETKAIRAFSDELSERSVDSQLLHTSHAFHSPMMEPILQRFRQRVEQIELRPPQIPMVSTVTGSWIAEDVTRADHWVRNLRRTVRFSDCLQLLLEDCGRILIEMGPGQTLSTYARQHSARRAGQIVLSSLRHPQDLRSDVGFALTTLGHLWLAGASIDWARFYKNERRRRVPLPTYPFERQRYWISEDDAVRQESTQAASDLSPQPELPESRRQIADWFYAPSWKRTALPPMPMISDGPCWVVFLDSFGFGECLVKKLQQFDCDVVTVAAGRQFARLSAMSYEIDPRQPDDYAALFEHLHSNGRQPSSIAHLWTLTEVDQAADRLGRLQASLEVGMHSLIRIAQALSRHESSSSTQMFVVSNGLHEVTGNESVQPDKATLLGPCKVIPLELHDLVCRSVDLEDVQVTSGKRNQLVEQLLCEFHSAADEPSIAYRGSHRWVPTVEPVHLKDGGHDINRLRQGGVYLLVGGLGGIGLCLAEYLARTVKAKLVLVARTTLPERNAWNEWLNLHGEDDPTSQKIRQLKSIEHLGSELFIAGADVTDRDKMALVVRQAEQKFGPINGMIHCAGVIDDGGAILRRTHGATDNLLASKVHGTLVLDDVLQHRTLDFVVLCSSIATVLYHNQFGQVSYVAANSFLDAYSSYKRSRNSTFTVTINWDDWQEVGMSVRAEREFQKTYGLRDPLFDPLDSLSPSEGASLFGRLIHSQLTRVLISTRDLRARVDRDVSISNPFLEAASSADLSGPVHPRPDLSTAYEAPRNDFEMRLATIWQELLGIDSVGIHDDYFELGGDSLRATQFLTRIGEVFQVEVPLSEVYQNPSIAGLAAKIEALCWSETGDAQPDALKSSEAIVEGVI